MRYLLLIFLLKLSLISYSQEKLESFQFQNTPLKEVFSEIESAFNVRFSYRNELGEKYRLNANIRNVDLDKLLSHLSEQLPVSFQKISKRYISVKETDTSITIKGRLVDKRTQSPLWAGTIVNLSQTKGCSSDKDGYFTLNNNQLGDTIAIRYIGYTSIKFPVKIIGENQLVKIEMEESHEVLDEILIDYIGDGTKDNDDGSLVLSVSDFKQLSTSADADYFGSLQLLPGINNPSESNADLFIRGGSPDQNLILWNGITVYHNAHFFGMISAFNSNQLSNIKVFRSGASAKYGNRVSGVIDMQSDKRVPDEFSGSFSMNFNFVEGLAKLPVKKDKIGMSVSVRRSYSDIKRTPTFKNFADRIFQNTIIDKNAKTKSITSKSDTRFFFEDLTLNTSASISDNSNLYVNYLYSKNDLKYKFAFEDLQKSKDRLRIENHGLSIISENKWSNKLRQNIKLEYSYYDLLYRLKIVDSSIQKSRKDNTVQELGLETDFLYRFNSNNKLKAGFQFSRPKVNAKFYDNLENTDDVVNENDLKDNYSSLSLFSEYQWNRKKIYFLNLGLRASYISTSDKVYLEPRLYAKIRLNKALHLKFTAGMKSQFLSQILEFNTTDFGLENQMWALLDDNELPVQKSEEFVAGVEWEKNGLSLEMETYYKHTDGLTSISKAFKNREEPYSEGDSRTLGVDLFFKKRGKYSNYMLSYTIQNTDYKFYDMGNGYFPGNHDIRHSFSAVGNWFWNNFQFSLIWNWHTGRPYTPAAELITIEDDNYIDYDGINSKRLPAYQRLDFNSSYNFSISKNGDKKMTLGFTLLNVFDRKNLLDRSYNVVNTDKPNLQELNSYSLGITPNIFLRIEF